MPTLLLGAPHNPQHPVRLRCAQGWWPPRRMRFGGGLSLTGGCPGVEGVHHNEPHPGFTWTMPQSTKQLAASGFGVEREQERIIAAAEESDREPFEIDAIVFPDHPV